MLDVFRAYFDGWGPLLVFAIVFVSSMGIPIPALAVLVLTGSVLAAPGTTPGSIATVFVAAACGALAGDTVLYFVGRRAGLRVLHTLCRISLTKDKCVNSTGHFFERFGARILLFARFVPGLSLVSIPLVGAARVPISVGLRYDLPGIAAWVGVALLAGYVFADQVTLVFTLLDEAGLGIAGVLVLVVVAYAGLRWARRAAERREGFPERIEVAQLVKLMDAEAPPLIIDVRSGVHTALEPVVIRGARVMRPDELGADEWQSPAKKLRSFVIYCSCPNEVSAVDFALRLRALGFTSIRVLRGGLDAWRDAGGEIDQLTAPVPVSVKASGGGTGIAPTPGR